MLPQSPEAETAKQQNIEQRRREAIAEIARRERKERIARELQQALERRQQEKRKQAEQQGKTTQEQQPQRPQKNIFNRLAGLMLEHGGRENEDQAKKPTEGNRPLTQVELDNMELSMRSLNILLNRPEIETTKAKQTRENHLRQRESAQEAMLSLLNFLDDAESASSNSIPADFKAQANTILRDLINTNREIYAELSGEDLADDPKKLQMLRDKIKSEQEKTHKKADKERKNVQEEKSKQEQEKERQANLRAQRVAIHREYKKAEKRYKELTKKGHVSLTRAEQEELEELKQKRPELLAEQYDALAAIKTENTIHEVENNPQLIDLITNQQIVQEVIAKCQVEGVLLPAEQDRLDDLVVFLQRVDAKKDLEGIVQRIKSGQNITEEELQILQIITHPEVSGRIELARRKSKEDRTAEQCFPEEEMAREYAEYNEWRLTGPVEERLAAVEEEYMKRLMLLNERDFSGMDFDMVLEEYGFGRIKFGADDVEFVPTPEAQQPDVKEALDRLQQTVKKLRDQHQVGWEIVGYEEDQNAPEQKRRHEQLVKDIESDLIKNFSDPQRIGGGNVEAGFLQGLFASKAIELQVTPTGLSIIVDPMYVQQKYKGDLTNLLKVLGYQGEQAANSVSEYGLGVTLQEHALDNFRESLKNNPAYQFTESSLNNILPSVHILVVPEGVENKYENVFLMQRHETTDYMLEAFRQGESEGEQLTYARALRELSSRINDGTVGARNINTNEEIKMYLDDLYLRDNRQQQDEQLPQTHESILDLIRTVEKIIKDRRSSVDNDELTQDIENTSLRETLAFRINSALKDGQAITPELIQKIKQSLLTEYGVSDPGQTAGPAFNEGPYRRFIVEPGFENFYMYQTPPTQLRTFVGVLDSTNPLNMAKKEAAATAQFGGESVPAFYGAPGEAAINTRWEYANEKGVGWIPADVALPVVGRIPVLRNVLERIPVPTLYPTRTYLWKRAVAAKWNRSFDRRKRYVGRSEFAHDDLGAAPYKKLALINPMFEHVAKRYGPGYDAAHKISERREQIPYSRQAGIYDLLYTRGPAWINELGVSDGLIEPKNMVRYLGKMLGLKYEFEGQQYKFGRDRTKLQEITSIDNSELEKLEETAKKNMRAIKDADGNIVSYAFKYDGPRYKPSQGLISSFVMGGFGFGRKGPSETQQKVASFFKKKARREDLPKDTANIFEWERQIGSDYRKYLQQRDGYLALATLGAESTHFANTQQEAYSLDSLTHLLHIAEEKAHDRMWLRNGSGKVIKVSIMKDGRPEQVTIYPDEFLRDPNGNLIPEGVELKQDDNKNYVLQNGQFVLDIDYDKIQSGDSKAQQKADRILGLWGRLVGDYENPHLRYIRLNSDAAKQFAIGMVGNDESDGFQDGDNILLRTDGIKAAIWEMNTNRLRDAISNGLPPDRRYHMVMENGIPIVDFIKNPVVVRKNGARQPIQLFDDTGNATADFRTVLQEKLDVISGGGQDPENQLRPLYDQLVGQNFFTKADLTKEEISKAIETVLGIGQGRPLAIDRFFKDFINFSEEASWANPYRQEQEAIPPLEDQNLEYIMDTMTGGFDTIKGRYERAQDFLYQWQKAVLKIHQYERIAYTAIAHYKGLARTTERMTRISLTGGLLGMMFVGNPIFFYSFLAALGSRVVFKPWATKESKMWTARRIKALQRIKEVESLDGIFKQASDGGVPTEYELGRMFSQCEEIIFWLEDLATTDPPDDWYPEHDPVINSFSNMWGGTKDRLKKWIEQTP